MALDPCIGVHGDHTKEPVAAERPCPRAPRLALPVKHGDAYIRNFHVQPPYDEASISPMGGIIADMPVVSQEAIEAFQDYGGAHAKALTCSTVLYFSQ